MSEVTNEKSLTIPFVDAAQNLPYVGNQFDFFEAEGITDRLYFHDDGEAMIEPKESELTTNLSFQSVRFEQKSVYTEVVLSQAQINDTPIDLKQTGKTAIANRVVRKMQSEAMGYGDKYGQGKHMQSILDYNSLLTKEEVKAKQDASTPFDNPLDETITKIANIKDDFADVKAMYADFAEDAGNLETAYFVVDNAQYALDIVDVANAPLMKNNDIAGSIGSIYNLPVFVQNMNGKAKMVLMRKGAYAVSVNNKLDIFENDGSNDTEVRKAGAVVISGEIMASGMVANPYGIRILKGAIA